MSKKTKKVRRPVSSSVAPTTAIVSAPKGGTGTASADGEDIPILIRYDSAALKLWENATEEERTVSRLICELHTKASSANINTYFDFAESWEAVFPWANKKLYHRGMEAVKTGAKLAGVGKSTIYDILQVARLYGRKGYESLKAKAQKNGGEIKWTHLRNIAQRLKDNKEARLQIEQAITHNRLTEKQVTALIDELVPSDKSHRSLAESDKYQTAIQKFIAAVSTVKHLVKNLERYSQVIEDVNTEFCGDQEQARIIVEQSSILIGCKEDLQDFFATQMDFVQELHDAALIVVNGESKKKTKAAAHAIKEQIATEKKEKQQTAAKREIAATVRGGDVLDTDDSDADDYDEDNIEVGEDGEDIFDEFGEMT